MERRILFGRKEIILEVARFYGNYKTVTALYYFPDAIIIIVYIPLLYNSIGKKTGLEKNIRLSYITRITYRNIYYLE